MGKPAQLSKQQVEKIKKQNNGKPVATQQIEIKSNTAFTKEIEIRENDVIMLNFIKK